MSFAAPEAFALLILPVLALLLRPPRERTASAAYLPPALAERMRGEAHGPPRAGLWAPALVWLLLVVALAGPQRTAELDLITASGRDIVLAIDLSGSMEKEDFLLDGAEVSRLDAVKSVASRFVEGRAGDRVGLVVFGDRAYVAAPLTHDVASVAHVISTLTVGVSGRSTAISDGLGLAMKRLEADGAGSRVVILLSDGVDTTGKIDPAEAAGLAAQLGIRVHTVALGPDSAVELVGRADALDVKTLGAVAAASGGQMFRVRTTDELQAVADAVDRLEPSQSDVPPIRAVRGYWMWPAGAAVVLSLAVLAAGRRLL
ncbi:hypothetical protein DLJ53_07385 [Acuticoccus sediminis]|uniref:VWFA domain-containing protein n=1 Tax=Acuticoccus sediminis TaxID=2184697 RepID=A0A8B2NVT4_9HYPH|nr:VWA domain-containing protein [Acuticoccus sediminis]RAI04257.1 hypothetical protein DLJ53_07385 [Acuticoccus sediminis]